MSHNSLALFSRSYPNPKVFDRYTANALRADLVADFANGRFAFPDGSGGVTPGNFDDLFVYASGDVQRQMTDGDGLAILSCGNEVSNPTAPVTQTLTGLTSGSDMVVSITGPGSVTLSGAAAGVATEGSDVQVTLSGTSLTLTVSGDVRTMTAYRVELGGMADNPMQAGKFAEGFLPRLNHHGPASVLMYDRHNFISDAVDLSTWSEAASLPGASNRGYTQNLRNFPNGVQLGKLVTSTGNDLQRIFTLADDVNIGKPGKYGVFAQPAEFTRLILQFSTPATRIRFDLVNLTATPINTDLLDSYGVENIGGGLVFCWIRAKVEDTAAGGRLVPQVLLTNESGEITFAGDGTSGVFVGGAHLIYDDLPINGFTYLPTRGTPVLPKLAPGAFVNKGLRLNSEPQINFYADSEDLSADQNSPSTTTFDAPYEKRGFTFYPAKPDAGAGTNGVAAPGFRFDYADSTGDTDRVGAVVVDASGGINLVGMRRASTNTTPLEPWRYSFHDRAFVINDPAADAKVYPLGDDLYLFTFRHEYTGVGGTAAGYIIGAFSAADTDGVKSFAVAAPVFAPGSVFKGYVPTLNGGLTLPGETLSVPAAVAPFDVAGFSTSLSCLISYSDNNSASEVVLFDWRDDANNRATLTLDTSSGNTGLLILEVVNAGSSVSVSAPTQLVASEDTQMRVAFRVTASEIAIALNGTASAPVANSAGIPDLSSADCSFAGNLIVSEHLMWADDIGQIGITEKSTGA